MSNYSAPKFIISGAPASGKGTQCEYLKDEFKVVHLSTGDMLRAAVEAGTDVGIEAKGYMDRGELVPDSTIIKVVIERLKQSDCIERGWLLDGFPRTRAQADALEEAGITCDVFIQLDVDDELLVERVVGRRMDPETGKIYHLKFSPPPEEVTDRLIHRSDDTEEKIVVRIDNYRKNLNSIIDKYSSSMIRVNVKTNDTTSKQVWAEVIDQTKGMLDSLAPPTGRGPPKFIISGAPASGKGTQCEFIKKAFNVVHLSTGDMLRAAVEAGTAVGLEAKGFMDRGALVPDSTIINVVIERLKKQDCRTQGWLLDGFPRTRAQADALEKAGIQCDVFIQLDVDDDVLVERVVGRRMDSVTGKIYHMKYSPPPSDIHHRLIHRSDDTEDKAVVRLQNYKNNLDSIVDKYANTIIRVDGNRTPAQIWNEINSKVSRELKYHVVFILGGPGSGKGTLCDRVKKEFKYTHLSAGDLLRDEMKRGGEYASLIQSITQAGKLVPAELTVKLLSNAMNKEWLETKQKKFLIDGFPRNVDNATAWYEAMSEIASVDMVITLECNEDTMKERLMGRSKTSGRADDNEETIMKRFVTFHNDTEPILKSFDRLGKLRRIDASYPPKVVYNQAAVLFRALELIPVYQRTFALITPESVAANHVPEIIKSITAANINIVARKLVTFSRSAVDAVYGKSFSSDMIPRVSQLLTSGPSLALILEGTDAINVLNEISGPTVPSLAKETSPSSIRALFGTDEVRSSIYTSANEAQAMSGIDFWFDPSGPGSKSEPQTDSPAGLSYGGLPLEDTFAIIKPISAMRDYDDIIAVINGQGFEIISELRTKFTPQIAHQFYGEHVGKPFFETLVGYMSSGIAVALHLRRPAAITAWRHLMGPTSKAKAVAERFDSIRANYAFDGTRNAVHGSDSAASAVRELGFFFSIGLFNTRPISATPKLADIRASPMNAGGSVGSSKTKYSKKVHTVPSINRNDIAKMESYVTEELNPIMNSLLRNLVVSRPKDVEDVAISKLTDIKYQRMMNGSISQDSVVSIQEEARYREQMRNGSSLEEDSVM